MPDTPGMAKMLTGLLRAGHLAGFEQLPAVLRRQAAEAGLRNARCYLADLRGQTLRELTGRGPTAGRGGESLSVEDSPAGLAYRHMRVIGPAGEDEPPRYWAPVLDGTQRLGVLRVDAEGQHDEAVQEAVEALASVTGLLLTSKRPVSDSYARLERTQPTGVSAEMLGKLMPPTAYADEQVVLAAASEPAAETGGDAFDYAIAGTKVHLALFDAMGHDSRAGLMASLAVATCRASRRLGNGLVAITDHIESTLLDEFGPGRYVTGVVAELDTRSGVLAWVNRGHYPPSLVRGGHALSVLDCPPGPPMGTDLGLPVKRCREQLQRGDRLLLHTDGVVQREASERESGLTRFVDSVLKEQAEGLSVPETLRRLMRSLSELPDERPADDATVLFAEWRGAGSDPLHPPLRA
jgi:serine phosphatase RsbU (regulator of sigma subunit)